MPTYLKYKYNFSSSQFKVGSGVGSGFFSAEPDPDPGEKMFDPQSWDEQKKKFYYLSFLFFTIYHRSKRTMIV